MSAGICCMKNNNFETNLSKIEQLAAVREEENYRFRRFLKNKNGAMIDAIALCLHDEITKVIDCKICANCCIQLKPRLEKVDIDRLARMEDMDSQEYMAKYCEVFEFGAIYLKTKPCRYVDNKKCSVYEHRPEECRLFPYTDKENFNARLFSMIEYYEICPIVFNVMEKLKIEMRFLRK